MATRRIDIATQLHADIGDDGVAELVFGPEGGMPATDAAGHAALGSVWARLAAEPGVRCILVRSLGKGFCAGGTLGVVQDMVSSEAARLRVMREGRRRSTRSGPRASRGVRARLDPAFVHRGAGGGALTR
jgi:enoyl-CoA hydratase